MTIDASATPAQILVVLGFLEYAPAHRQHAARANAASVLTVYTLARLAVAKGWPRIERRRFIGGLRTGKPGAALLTRAQALCDVVGPAEVTRAFERLAAWTTLRETGRLPPGWVWPKAEPAPEASRKLPNTARRQA